MPSPNAVSGVAGRAKPVMIIPSVAGIDRAPRLAMSSRSRARPFLPPFSHRPDGFLRYGESLGQSVNFGIFTRRRK